MPAPGQYSMCIPPAPYQPMIPAFKTMLLEVLNNIFDYSIDSWREYYAKHPADLALHYIRSQHSNNSSKKVSTVSAPLSTTSIDLISPLTEEEIRRLIHEADYKVFSLLQTRFPATNPVLQAISERFSEENGLNRIYL